MSTRINEISAEAFARLGDESISLVRDDAAPLQLRLCAVRSLHAGGPRKVAPFSATLSAPDGAQLSQGVYTLRHPTLGELALFMVPIGMQADGPGYEIVFN